MIRIYCDAADAVLKETQTLTAGMINYPEVLLTFSDAWDGYGKAVIVKAGEVEESALIVNNKFVVPSECLAESGVNLIVGVSGSDGVHTIPTIWCSCGEIMDGTDVNDSTAVGTATPSLVEQMLSYAQEVVEEAQYLKDYIIKTVAADATGANAYGTANVTVSDSGEGENRTLTFTFTNLKGNGITSLLFTASGENKGRVQVKLDDGTTTNYDGIKEALAAIDSLISDVETAETARNNAESDRATAETSRESAEQDRVFAEQSRETAETARQNAEGLRDSNEGVRVQNEAEREENENTRKSNEAARVSDESTRSSSEASRVSAEANRVSAESARVSAESARASAESSRASAESTRVSNEATRVSSESTRVSNESTRISNESTRVSNESGRVSAEEARAAEWEDWEYIVEDAEAYARGTRGGEDVPSSDPAYHNNSKYYSEQASSSATDAASAETAAETAQTAAEAAQTAAETAQGKAEDAQEAAETAAATFSTDKTLTVSDKAADAKVTGDKIAELSTAITQEGTVSTTETHDAEYGVSVDQIFTVLNGYVRIPTASSPGQISSSGTLHTYYFKASEDMEVYITSAATTYVIRYSDEQPVVGTGKPFTGAVYKNGNDDFPTAQNPLSISKNQYVAFSTNSGDKKVTLTIITTGSSLILKDTLPLTEEMEGQVEEMIGSEIPFPIDHYGLSSDALLYLSEVPSYYGEVTAETPVSYAEAYSYLERKISSIPKGKSFIFITDTHWAGNQKHSTQLINYVRKRTGIHKVVFGGDILGNADTPYLFVKNGGDYLMQSRQAFGKDYMPAVGDHDSNSNLKSGNTIEQQWLPYSEMAKMFDGDLNGVAHFYQPTEKLAEYATGANYNECLAFFKTVYYVDDDYDKVRYIVLNCGNSGAEYGAIYDVFGSDGGTTVIRLQLDWLAETLMSTPSGYDIVVAAHKLNYSSSSSDSAMKILSGFARAQSNCKPAPSSTGTLIDSWWPNNTQYDFSNRPDFGKIISVNGHRHRDFLLWFGLDANDDYTEDNAYDQTTPLNQKTKGQIITTVTQTDSAGNVDSPDAYTMTVGTFTEQCFDVFTIVDDGIVITRFGAGDDRRIYISNT